MYCFVADLLGFTTMMRNLPEQDRMGRVEDWINVSRHLAHQHELKQFRFVSDAVVCGNEESKFGLQRLISFARLLLEHGLQKSFLLRGAITRGDVQWGEDIVYGPALIRALELNSLQDWIGVMCDGELPDVEALWNFDRLFPYPVPMKSGPMKLYPAVAWHVPSLGDLATKLSGGGLSAQLEVWRWEVQGRKMENTIIFSQYLRRVKSMPGLRPSQFYGLCPQEILEVQQGVIT